MTTSNLSRLTNHHKIVRNKKKQKQKQLQEITWNPEDRKDYLTGFQKRKQQRKEKAKEKAILREKEERRQERQMVYQYIIDIMNFS